MAVMPDIGFEMSAVPTVVIDVLEQIVGTNVHHEGCQAFVCHSDCPSRLARKALAKLPVHLLSVTIHPVAVPRR